MQKSYLPALVDKRPQHYVVNTDSCGKRGKHWTVIYFPKEGRPCEFFDSLGRAPEYYHRRFRNVLLANGPQYQYIVNRLQALTSDVCGQYCIYFVKESSLGRTMKDICHDFRVNEYKQNDAFVSHFVADI